MDRNAEKPISAPVRHPSARLRPEQEEAFDGLLLAMLARKRLLILVAGERGERGRVFRELTDHVESDGSLVVTATGRSGMQVEDMIAGDAEDVDLETVVGELEERLDLAGAGLLAVEEAQLLDGRVLADLADLSLSETPAGRFLQVLLCGSPELERALARPDLAEAVRDYGVIYRLGDAAGCSTVPAPVRHGEARDDDEDTLHDPGHDTIVNRPAGPGIGPANDWLRPMAAAPAPAPRAVRDEDDGDGYGDDAYPDLDGPEADRPVASRRAAVAGVAVAVGVLVAVGVAGAALNAQRSGPEGVADGFNRVWTETRNFVNDQLVAPILGTAPSGTQTEPAAPAQTRPDARQEPRVAVSAPGAAPVASAPPTRTEPRAEQSPAAVPAPPAAAPPPAPPPTAMAEATAPAAPAPSATPPAATPVPPQAAGSTGTPPAGPSAGATAPPPQVAALPPATAPAATPEPPPLDAAARQRIAALVESARRQINAKRLTTPAGDNAAETVQRIRTIDPRSADADALVAEIKDTYRRWAVLAERDRNLADAQRFYERALSVDPNDREIQEALRSVGGTQPPVDAAPVPTDPETVLASRSSALAVLERPDALRGLLGAMGDPDRRLPDGKTLLMLASEAGLADAARALLGAGAKANARSGDGATPVMYAAWYGRDDVIGLLASAGADLDARNTDGKTALMAAAARGNTAAVRALVDRGAAVDAAASHGWTALMYAANAGHEPVARLLVERGADPFRSDERGNSAYTLGALQGHTEVVEALRRR